MQDISLKYLHTNQLVESFRHDFFILKLSGFSTWNQSFQRCLKMVQTQPYLQFEIKHTRNFLICYPLKKLSHPWRIPWKDSQRYHITIRIACNLSVLKVTLNKAFSWDCIEHRHVVTMTLACPAGVTDSIPY